MKPELPSNRSFALVFFVFFFLVGVLAWWKGWRGSPLFFFMSAGIGAIGILRPAWLAPCNRAWMRLAELLHRVVNPVVLAILFFAIFTPFALVVRIFRKDPLGMKADPAKKSYWLPRTPPGPDSNSMINQF